jgi:hypothetical protein
MTLDTATQIVIAMTSPVELLEEWNKPESKAKMILAAHLVSALEENKGKVSFSDISFAFILGVQVGRLMEKSDQ